MLVFGATINFVRHSWDLECRIMEPTHLQTSLKVPPFAFIMLILLRWVVGTFYAVDCEVCVGELVMCGSDFFGF